MEKKQKARNHAFDILCGICIVRMVTLHIMTLTGQRDQVWWQEVMQWTYYFMSFFFFKAGYFCRSVGGRNRAYLIDRSQRLLAPYLSSAFIGLLVYFSFYYPLKNKYGHFVEDISWSQLYKTSGVYGNTPIWFLFSFFCMYVVAHFTEKVRYLRWVWALAADELVAVDSGQPLIHERQQCLHGSLLLLPWSHVALGYGEVR